MKKLLDRLDKLPFTRLAIVLVEIDLVVYIVSLLTKKQTLIEIVTPLIIMLATILTGIALDGASKQDKETKDHQ